MSTNPILVPTSMVSQFLATEKIASRKWLQCQMESLLDHVFDQLNTKFEDFVASNAIGGTGDDYQMDPDGIEQQMPLFQVHSHHQFTANANHLNSKLPIAVGQSQNSHYRGNDHVMDCDGQVNPDGIESEEGVFNQTTYNQAQYPPVLPFPSSNLEQSNQNDEEYSLDQDPDRLDQPSNGQLNDEFDDAASQMDSDEPEMKDEIDDTNNELITTDESQYPPSTSNLEQSNQNDDEEEYGLDENDQPSNDDTDDYALRVDSNKPEVKEEEDFDETNNEIIISNDESQISQSVFTLPSNEQVNQKLTSESNQNQTSENDEDLGGGSRDDEQPIEYGDIDDDALRGDSDEPEKVKEEFDDTYNEIANDESQTSQSAVVPTSNEHSNQNLTSENDEDEYDLDGDYTRDDEQPSGIGDIDDDARMDSNEVKEEIDESNNQVIITVHPHSQPDPTLNVEQSNGNDEDDEYDLNGAHDQPSNEQQLRVGNDVNERNDDHNEESSRPRKRRRTETIQPNNNRQSRVTRKSSRLSNRIQADQPINEQPNLDSSQSSEQTDETSDESDETNEVNQDKQIITLKLQCLETGCSQKFNNKTELKAHMSAQHNILSNRCFVKDCKQSFSNQFNLGNHINQIHSSITQWHCDKCTKHFLSYSVLSTHNYLYHYPGNYQCAFPSCTFTGKQTGKVFSHFNLKHKVVEFVCQSPNCGRKFNNSSNFNRHKRVHEGIKPYRCKWSGCDYANADAGNALKHIKVKHLAQGQSSRANEDDDPKKYLEVLRELL